MDLKLIETMVAAAVAKISENIAKELKESLKPNFSVDSRDLLDRVQLLEALERKQWEVHYFRAMTNGIKPNIEEMKSIIPASGTCWTCNWNPKKTCNRQGSLKIGQCVSPFENCSMYSQASVPKLEIVGKHHRKRKTITAQCNKCKGVFMVNMKTGKLYPHDIHGKYYFGLSKGDRSKPCDGVPVQVNERKS
jgi:hypothetical protein